jgi:hypothetical protein
MPQPDLSLPLAVATFLQSFEAKLSQLKIKLMAAVKMEPGLRINGR